MIIVKFYQIHCVAVYKAAAFFPVIFSGNQIQASARRFQNLDIHTT